MLEGLMQNDYPLTLQHVLWRMRTMNAASEVATLTDGDPIRSTYGEVAERVDRLCSALTAMGVKPGDRVATLSWNTQRHLELFLAVPCMGAVLHTLNIRLFPEQLTYIANHAEDSLLFVDEHLIELADQIAPTLTTVRERVTLDDSYEQLLAAADPHFDYPELDERMAAGLCYTSGTTGNPKGVLYSHRSNLLHAIAQGLAVGQDLRHDDRVMPVVPMFHANSWGFPYACPLMGAAMVMPSNNVNPERIAKAIVEEQITFTAAVPTVWLDLLAYADAKGADLSSIRAIIAGGSAVPMSLMKAYEERFGLDIVHAWGMTETSPLASVSVPGVGDHDDAHWAARARQGRPLPMLEIRIVDDEGEPLPWDDEATGELEIRGPWIARAYYNSPEGDDRFHDGWLRTGDIAAIGPDGSIRISDRSKDVIKSGGEWISSVDLEGAIMGHEAVREAAVIGMPHPRWDERPLACVVVHDGRNVSPDELRDYLRDHVAKWWLPDEIVFIDEVPKTSVGKFDKKVLRQRLADGELGVAPQSVGQELGAGA